MHVCFFFFVVCFFFNDTATTEIYTLSLHDALPILKADLSKKKAITSAFKNADIAYYFVHSLGETDDFEEIEAQTAANFANAASNAQLSKIIYLSALAQNSKSNSAHMSSRWKVGEILRNSGVPDRKSTRLNSSHW